MRLVPLIFILPVLWSCSPPDGDQTVQGGETLSLRATGDIITPEPMIKAAFLPNPVSGTGSSFSLNLPGQIILLSESGDIWQTTTQGEAPALVSKGKFIDVLGFSSIDTGGTILALSDAGSISAFLKKDDAGNFTRLTVSQGGEPVRSFCNGGNLITGEDGKLHALSVTVSGNNVAEITTQPMAGSINNVQTCNAGAKPNILAQTEKRGTAQWEKFSNEKWTPLPAAKGFSQISLLEGNVLLGLGAKAGTPVVFRKNNASTLAIEDGLSIRGVESAAFITSAHAPMGTAFSDGLILIADRDEPRLVMISMEYAKRELGNDAE